jgi:transcriptional regulator with XRE-family HTH domain
MEIRKRVGLLVKAQRKERGWSQEELAHRAGLHRTFVSSIERGTKTATIVSLHTVTNAMGLTVSEMLDGLLKSDHEDPKSAGRRGR